MRQRRRVTLISLLIAAFVIVFAAVNLGSCAYRASISGNMALDDASVDSALVAAKEGQPSYTLVAGMDGWGTEEATAGYLGVLRVDPDGGRMTLLSLPSNIAYRTAGDSSAMLRDIPHLADEGALVSAVADICGNDISHYVRITEDGFKRLVDQAGGIEVDVSQRVDDPSVSSVVIDRGAQRLSGEEAFAFVSAFNYGSGVDGRAVRANNQAQVFQGLAQAFSSKSGLDFLMSADALSGCFKTDMSYEELDAMAKAYSAAGGLTVATAPGSSTISGSKTYFTLSSTKWPQVKDLFHAGEEPVIAIDTSGVDRSKTSIIILNGSGTEGLALQASDRLQAQGWTVQETGNADSYVYDETLVIYRNADGQSTAQAIVDDLGVGRAVSASVYYNLKTDIQVVVGKDWQPLG